MAAAVPVESVSASPVGQRFCFRTTLSLTQCLVEGVCVGVSRTHVVLAVAESHGGADAEGTARSLLGHSFIRVRIMRSAARQLTRGIEEEAASHFPVLEARAFPLAPGEDLQGLLAFFTEPGDDYQSLSEAQLTPRGVSRPGASSSPGSFVDLGSAGAAAAGDSNAIYTLLKQIRDESRNTAARVAALETGTAVGRPVILGGGSSPASGQASPAMQLGGKGPPAVPPHALQGSTPGIRSMAQASALFQGSALWQNAGMPPPATLAAQQPPLQGPQGGCHSPPTFATAPEQHLLILHSRFN